MSPKATPFGVEPTASVRPQFSPLQAGTPIATPLHPTPEDLAFGRSLGPADAPVTLDLWADFQCPACQAFAFQMEPALIDTYVRPGKVRLNFHDLSFIGPESLGAAIGARCADRQGKFWAYHDLIYYNQGAENSGWFTYDRSIDFARFLNLDVAAFSSCSNDPAIQAAVEADTRAGVDLGVRETPTLFVAGVAIGPVYDWQTIRNAVDEALSDRPIGSP
jgi:protein-disulfide isomerase